MALPSPVFVGYTDHLARAFDARSGSIKQVLRGHTDSVNCLAICDNKLYTASSDGTLRVWDVSTLRWEQGSFTCCITPTKHYWMFLVLRMFTDVAQGNTDSSHEEQSGPAIIWWTNNYLRVTETSSSSKYFKRRCLTLFGRNSFSPNKIYPSMVQCTGGGGVTL